MLRETLEPHIEFWKRLLGLLSLLCQPLLFPFVFGDVFHVVLPLQPEGFDLDQVVGHAEEGRLHRFGIRGGRPALFLAELVLEFVENFLRIPAHPVELGDHAWWDRSGKVRDEGELPVGGGIGVDDLAHAHPLAGGDLAVGDDAVVDRVGAIPRVLAEGLRAHVLLGVAEEVDAAALFPAVPLPEVDARAIPDPKHPLPLRGTTAQVLDRRALEPRHVVLLELVLLVGSLEMEEGIVSEVEPVEMSDGVLLSGFLRVVRGGGVPVAISGEYLEALERRDGGQAVGRRRGQMVMDRVGGLLAEGESAAAFEGLEEMGSADLAEVGEGELGEEVQAAVAGGEHPAHAGLEPVLIREFGAGSGGGQMIGDVEKRAEEEVGDGSVCIVHMEAKKILPPTCQGVFLGPHKRYANSGSPSEGISTRMKRASQGGSYSLPAPFWGGFWRRILDTVLFS